MGWGLKLRYRGLGVLQWVNTITALRTCIKILTQKVTLEARFEIMICAINAPQGFDECIHVGIGRQRFDAARLKLLVTKRLDRFYGAGADSRKRSTSWWARKPIGTGGVLRCRTDDPLLRWRPRAPLGASTVSLAPRTCDGKFDRTNDRTPTLDAA